MSDALPTLAIIVVNYNTPRLVERLIASIKEHTTSVDYEVVVVNNGCRSDGKFVATGSTFIRVVESPINLGFGAAVNRAAATCKQPLLLLANSDVHLTSNVIPRMIKYLQEHSEVAACSPRTVFPDGSTHSSIRLFPTYSNLRSSRGAFIRGNADYTIEADENRKPVEAMAATFFLIRTEDFERLNRFDQRFFMYVEDTDLCKRLHDAGRALTFLGDMTVVHEWGASTRHHLIKMKFHHHRSIWKYFRKHYPKRHLANFWLAIQLCGNFALVASSLLLRGKGGLW